MRKLARAALPCLLACLAGCSEPARPKPAEPAKPTPPPVPAEITQVAERLLGSQAEVLVFGDLARTGRQQALIINRMLKPPTGMAPGNWITRAVIAENEGEKWKEVFRCDEHLKNPNGFLGGTPIAPVVGWRLQYEQSPEKGMVLYLTPFEPPGAGHIPTIAVRWNSQVKRYQSLDRNYEHFLGELPALEKMNSYLK